MSFDNENYERLYRESVENPEEFWAKAAERISWYQKWDKVKSISFDKPIQVKWFEGAKLNVAYNCVDRHVLERPNDIALIWEANDTNQESRKFSFKELQKEVSRFANLLKYYGVKKGDRVTLYLPMVPESIFSMLACARIGAVHSVVFGGFSPDSLASRVNDCESDFVITANIAKRGAKKIALKENVDQALEKCPQVRHVLVLNTEDEELSFNKRDIDYFSEVEKMSDECPCEEMDSEDPLFILYTSGSTGKPKGVLHTTGGYLLYASLTHEHVFDYQRNDVYWCTADIGWITGHSYVVYGPLANGATTLIYEGVPNFPDAARHWEIVDRHSVNIYYTAPTAIRALMSCGDKYVEGTRRDSLKLLGTVGEPINPEAWKWYYEKVGDAKSPVVDTWWQTETGGVMIVPLPGTKPMSPGAASRPFFGIQPALVDRDGKILEGSVDGHLCILDSWPGQMRTVYKNHSRFEETYFSQYPGKYFTGDGARRDENGDLWITGRVDDVLNVSGHRLGTAEIESSLVSHLAVSEAAIVGFPHKIKGQGIAAYVSLMGGVTADQKLSDELKEWVKSDIGRICSLDQIYFTPLLPKTRSGKIMRRILRKIAEGEAGQLGDTSTLADPNFIQTFKPLTFDK